MPRLHGRRQGLLYNIAGCAALLLLVAGGIFALFPSKNMPSCQQFCDALRHPFCLDGKLFYYAGANSYDLFTFGDGSNNSTPSDIETKFMDKASIDAVFANAQSDQVKVMRTWMFDHETWHGFETAKGVYNEAEFDEFD